MTAPFPHHYEVELNWEDNQQGRLTAPPRPAIVGGPPPQFDGRPEWWSPEQLLLGALGLCLMTTYQSLAARKQLTTLSYHSQTAGTLEKTAAGIVFTSFTISVTLKIPVGDVE